MSGLPSVSGALLRRAERDALPMRKKAALRRTGRPRLDGGKAPQTRERILRCAIREFAQQGYRGGRVERIVDEAGVNLRLIYHYFGGKEELYLACLERVFVELRQAEHALELRALPPAEAMRKLIDFTFEHLSRHPEFIGMVRSENQLGDKGLLRRSRLVRTLTAPLLVIIEDLLERGRRDGVFPHHGTCQRTDDRPHQRSSARACVRRDLRRSLR